MAGFYDVPLVLTDGGIETRIMYEFARELPDFAACTLLDDAAGRDILTNIYRSYLDVAQRFKVPIQLGTPTWRASAHWISNVERANRDAVALLRHVVKDASVPVSIAGVLGPSHDGYAATGALAEDAGYQYHTEQANVLAEAGVDTLYAPTFPAVGELHGAARAMAETTKPFALAPMLQPDGTLMDGTPLAVAIERIDADGRSRPWHYMLGCLYPTHAQTALESLFRAAPQHAHRVIGLKANASPLSPTQLNSAGAVEEQSPGTFASDMRACADRFGLHVLGGCCGTNAEHIAAIAAAFRA